MRIVAGLGKSQQRARSRLEAEALMLNIKSGRQPPPAGKLVIRPDLRPENPAFYSVTPLKRETTPGRMLDVAQPVILMVEGGNRERCRCPELLPIADFVGVELRRIEGAAGEENLRTGLLDDRPVERGGR